MSQIRDWNELMYNEFDDEEDYSQALEEAMQQAELEADKDPEETN